MYNTSRIFICESKIVLEAISLCTTKWMCHSSRPQPEDRTKLHVNSLMELHYSPLLIMLACMVMKITVKSSAKKAIITSLFSVAICAIQQFTLVFKIKIKLWRCIIRKCIQIFKVSFNIYILKVIHYILDRWQLIHKFIK